MNERDELAEAIDTATSNWVYPVIGYSADRLAEALIEAGYHKTHTEWGIRYEAPNPPFPTPATHTIAMPDRAHAQAALQTGAPLRATNRRIVRRYTSDWEEVA